VKTSYNVEEKERKNPPGDFSDTERKKKKICQREQRNLTSTSEI
jgi:CRISPR/Cas system-associated protein Csx1